MKNLLNQTPPDDTGTETLRRFRYQAQLALPFCLACARKEEVRSVIMEHFEDIVVEYDNYWHFIQVKTRNANRGHWKLPEAIDGLKSLYRAFNETSHIEAKYSLFIEGAISAGDDLNTLVPTKKDISDSFVEKISQALKINDSDCRTFLKVVTVHPNQTPRANITSHNIHLIGKISAKTSIIEIETIERNLTDEIYRAMHCDCLGNSLYNYIVQGQDVETEIKLKIESKRLTAQSISVILGSLTNGNYPLLQRIIDLESPTPTNLEKKLIAGGATDRIIKDAKNLRANACIRETEVLASGFLNEEEKITDVQIRIQTIINSIVESHDESEKPAKIIWREVLNELTQKKEFLDPNLIYKQETFLLMGAACRLSDECHIDWGVKIA